MVVNNGLELVPWALCGMTLILLMVVSVKTRRRIARLEEKLKERCDDLGREVRALSGGGLGMGRRLMEAERRVQQMQVTLEEMRQNDPLRVSYDEASRLVELGADVEDLMNSCGISRPEAELVSALRRRKVVA